MQNDDGADRNRPLVSNRTMEIVVALVLLGGCAIVIHDSVRLGFGWREGEGPAPGYYPFWVATILGVSSLVNLVNALRGHGAGEIFVFDERQTQKWRSAEQHRGVDALQVHVFQTLLGIDHAGCLLGVMAARRAHEAAAFADGFRC